jgi:hypothetical protein
MNLLTDIKEHLGDDKKNMVLHIFFTSIDDNKLAEHFGFFMPIKNYAKITVKQIQMITKDNNAILGLIREIDDVDLLLYAFNLETFELNCYKKPFENGREKVETTSGDLIYELRSYQNKYPTGSLCDVKIFEHSHNTDSSAYKAELEVTTSVMKKTYDILYV